MITSIRKHFWLLPSTVVLLALVLGPKPALGQGPVTPCDPFVPEASSYSLVYTLPIPLDANYDNGLPPYSVDNAASIGSFDRIAYCLQLNDNWVWVSMDAFTTVPAQVGVPVISTGATFQQTVSNMNVFSNVGGIVTGTGISTGNIEFWHNCYYRGFINPIRTAPTLGLPGANNGLYDFDDAIALDFPLSCYGSMQVHNYGVPQTLFAYNRWDQVADGRDDDLGIGNNVIANSSPDGLVDPDWTFQFNARAYDVRTMHILVREGRPTLDHLTCYRIRPAEDHEKFEKREVIIRNQFGEQRFVVVRPQMLCVPSSKELVDGE